MAKCASLSDAKTFVLPLQDCSEENRMEVGSKSLGLYNLIKAGASVPSGFCITTSAFKYFLRHDDALSGTIQSLDREPPENTDAGRAQELYPKIRKGIVESSFDESLSNRITNAYHKLALSGSKLVAVRSSATSEGTASASSAGRRSTMLNISSEQDLIGAVKKVWANHYAADATISNELGALEQSAGVAVIVQTMVRASKSGVMFTANPSTMDRSMVLVEATGRVGEAFAFGDSTHDQYFVNKVTFEIEKRVLPQGAEASKPCLSQAEIRRLVEVGKSVEKYLHRPQEIGWIAEGTNNAGESDVRFFFVRSKPLPVPEGIKSPPGSNVFSFITSAVNRRVKVS